MPYPLPPRARGWGWAGIVAAALTGVYLIAYGDFIGRFFAFDDFAILDQAERIAAGGIAGAWRASSQPWPSFAQYRPLTNPGWFWLLRACFGLDPTRWSMVQLAAHILNALLVFGIARRLLRSPVAGLATALDLRQRAGPRARRAMDRVLRDHGDRPGLLPRALDVARGPGALAGPGHDGALRHRVAL